MRVNKKSLGARRGATQCVDGSQATAAWFGRARNRTRYHFYTLMCAGTDGHQLLQNYCTTVEYGFVSKQSRLGKNLDYL